MMSNAFVTPYVPSLYLPGAHGRFRRYPRQVRTAIPGAGFTNVGRLVWGSQLLDLDGSTRPQAYGKYPVVPLLGLAGDVATSLTHPVVLGAALIAIAAIARRRPAATVPNRRRRRRRR